eukprot:381196-Rhodomonas_salina.1
MVRSAGTEMVFTGGTEMAYDVGGTEMAYGGGAGGTEMAYGSAGGGPEPCMVVALVHEAVSGTRQRAPLSPPPRPLSPSLLLLLLSLLFLSFLLLGSSAISHPRAR